MTKQKKFLTIGVWVAILPYLGFPYILKNILFTITGIIIMYFSYVMYLENKKEEKNKTTPDNFSENHEFNNIEK